MSEACIWCGGIDVDAHLEHIVPEAIGCPPDFHLTGGVVCTRCNNGLAALDRAVVDEFDLLAFMTGVRRKGGRTPVVASRGNVRGSYVHGKPAISFNMERRAVEAHDGVRLSAFHGAPRNIAASFSLNGAVATVSGSIAFGQSPKFVRGLAKIALASVAYFLGADTARATRFDAVREFVVRGTGKRHALMRSCSDTKYRNEVWAPYQSATGDLAVSFRLGIVEFLIDLSPEEDQLPLFEAKQFEKEGANGWCVLPTRG